MKILYVANVRIPTEKAHGFQIMKTCEALAEAGTVVTLIVPFRVNKEQNNPFQYWGIKKIFEIQRLGKIDFLNLHFLPRRVAFILQSLSFALNVRLYLKKEKTPGIIYTRDREIAWVGLFSHIPYFVEMHFLGRKIGISALKKARHLFVLTGELKKRLELWGVPSEKISLLPDAVSLEDYELKTTQAEARKRLDLPTGKKIIVYTGKEYAWKGVETFRKSAEYLPEETIILIVGGNSDAKEGSGHGAKVISVGHRSRAEVVWYLKSADLAVLPNSGKYSISRWYTSPLKMFEYMAARVPIIASDLPSLREILSEKEVLFFTPDDPQSLALTLRQALEDEEGSRLRAERAYEKVRGYTWQERASRIKGTIMKVMISNE